MLLISVFIFLMIFLTAVFFVKELKVNTLEEKKVSFLLITNNCQDIVEGTVLEIIRFCVYYPWCEIIIVDRYSYDDTYNILLHLAKKYSIHLIQDGPDEIMAFRIGKGMCIGKKICLVFIDRDSSYKTILKKLHTLKNCQI